MGVCPFTPAIHDAVRAITPSQRGELEITHAIQWLIDQRRDVRSTAVPGCWKDTGNVTDMPEAGRSVLEGIESGVEETADDNTEIIARILVTGGAGFMLGKKLFPPAEGRP